MSFTECIRKNKNILMEGALGERLKREYGLSPDEHVALARMIYDVRGARALYNLWNEYIDIARQHSLPFLATTPTRRANRERIARAGYSGEVITDNVSFLRKLQEESAIEMYIGGLMGCIGDAYTGIGNLEEEAAFAFHRWQAELFAEAKADFLYAGIMPTLPEAAGIARAFESTGLPYIISLTIQANGRMIDGTTIADAIRYIDGITGEKPVCYMTNCVHPAIVAKALSQPFNQNDIVAERFLGIQGNTSPLSYAELDHAADLKCCLPEEFAEEMIRLRDISNIKIWGGCCGTDNRHMKCLAALCCVDAFNC